MDKQMKTTWLLDENFPLVIKMWVENFDTYSILYLGCKEGDERKLFNSLPNWVNSLGEVVEGCNGVFIRLTNKQ